MDRRRFLASISAGGLAGLAGCPARFESFTGSETAAETRSEESTVTDTPSPVPTGDFETESPTADDVRPPFRVDDSGFERRTKTGYESFTVRGINLGMAKPGAFPGQAAITRDEYDRWVNSIAEIANVIRTYTIHPPAFYRALAAHNESAADPLLLLQGTWVPTADLLEAEDATELSTTVDRELERTVDILHGDTSLPERPSVLG